MKTSRLAVPANPCAGSRRRAFASASRTGSPSSDVTALGRWLIRVSSAALLAVLLSVPAFAVNLAWDPNPEADIETYQLSYGTSSGVYTETLNAGPNTSIAVSGLTEGETYYFVVTAANLEGLKSSPSAEVSYQVPVSQGGTVTEISRTGWSLVHVTSEEPSQWAATNAFDGNPDTFWHTEWINSSSPPPYDLEIDLGAIQPVAGFRYLPRQDKYTVGNIGQFEFYTSMDGLSWGAPACAGTFPNTKAEKEVVFPVRDARFVRLRSLAEVNGEMHCSVAELNILAGAPVDIPANVAPVAESGAVTTFEDTQVSMTLAASDAEGDPLSYEIVSGPSKGTLSGAAPNLTYAPSADFNGSDSFTFRVSDGWLNSNTATVSITVTPVNDPPVAISKSVATAEDVPVSVVLAGGDIDGNPLTYTVVSGPGNGALSGTAPNLTYTPHADFNGSDSFTFRVNDGASNSNAATVSITVTPVNDAPVAVSNSTGTAANTPVSIVLSASDKDGDSLTFSIVSGPSKGVLSGTAPNLTYTPGAGFNGTDSFTFRARDGAVNSNTATVSIAVTAVDAPPVAIPLAVTTAEDVPVAIVLTASDGNGDPLTYSVVDGPVRGVLTGTAPNLTYSPGQDFYGSDSFTFRANDGTTNSNTATVSITVAPVNDAPVAMSQAVKTLEGTSVSVVLIANDKDSESLSYTVVTGPAHGTLSGAAPNLNFTPAAGFSGTDSFTFRASDGTANSNLATISITVDAEIFLAPPPPPPLLQNTPPVFVSNPMVSECAEDSQMVGRLDASDPDVADSLVFAKLSGPSWLTVSPGGQLGGAPSNQDVGVNSFVVRVSDSANASATADLTVIVINTNDAPVFTVSPIKLAPGKEGQAYDGASIADAATDPDVGDAISFSKVAGPEWLEVSADGGLSGTPPDGSAGMNSFTVRATDKSGATADSALQIVIGASGLPLPWQVEDLGRSGLPNRAIWIPESFSIEGTGMLGGVSDGGCFVWRTISGDCTITARLVSQGNGASESMAGLMIRDSLAANSQQVFVGLDGTGGLCWMRRSKTDGSTQTSFNGAASAPDTWLCLIRKGRTVTVYESTNGFRWSRVGSTNTRLGTNCYIGLSVAGGGENPNTAVFSDVEVSP